MNTPQQYIDGLEKKNRALTVKNDELSDLSEKKAQLERDYNILMATTVLRLKAEGNTATLVPTLAKGDRVVADAKYRLDVADGVYRACLESIKDIRSHIDTYRSLLTWLREEKRG
jgi:hypothetical protein